MIQAAQNQKQTNTGGLAKLLQLKIGAKGMLTVNIDIQDWLINSQVGELASWRSGNNIVQTIYVKFSDPEAGLQTKASSLLWRQKLLCSNWKL